MKRALFIVVALALVGGCKEPSRPPSPSWVVTDAGAIGADAGPDASLCERACANLARLGCTEATTACAPVCDDQLATDLGAFDPICAARAIDQAGLRRCGVRLCL